MLYNTSVALDASRLMTADWQKTLGKHVQVVLSGSLASGLFVWDDETDAIDVDVKLLVDENQVLDPKMWKRIEDATGLRYRKQRPMSNEPDETLGPGVLFENRFRVRGVSIPLEVEGALRNRRCASWAHLYTEVFTKKELADIIAQKARRKTETRSMNDKTAYKAYKAEVRQEADRRIVDRGLALWPAA